MTATARRLFGQLFTGPNYRSSIVLATSALCLVAWHKAGTYQFWHDNLPARLAMCGDLRVSSAVAAFVSSVVLLGLAPLLVVKGVLRERAADYGIAWGNVRFAAVCCALVFPLVVVIGYLTAQQPVFQAVYPMNPLACASMAALAWHLAGQIFWYAAWEFHFRGFIQNGVGKSHGISLGIWVQTLASALAHFGRPDVEAFASILAGVLWGLLAFRTRSLLAGILQHWLLGASLDYFLCRGSLGLW